MTVAALQTSIPPHQDGEATGLSSLQFVDPTLKPIIEYLKNSTLPADDQLALKLIGLLHSD